MPEKSGEKTTISIPSFSCDLAMTAIYRIMDNYDREKDNLSLEECITYYLRMHMGSCWGCIRRERRAA